MCIFLIFSKGNNGKITDKGEFLSEKEENKVEKNKIELDTFGFWVHLVYLKSHESFTQLKKIKLERKNMVDGTVVLSRFLLFAM